MRPTTKRGIAIINHMLDGELRNERGAHAFGAAIDEQLQRARGQFERDVAAVDPETQITWTGPMECEVAAPALEPMPLSYFPWGRNTK